MQTSIHSHPAYSTLIADLDHGEAIKAEPGAMVAQQNVTLATGASGGMFKGLKRMLGGESFFLNTFTANDGPGQVILAPTSPGDIQDFQLQPGQNLFIQSGSFLACTPNVQTGTKFQGLRSVIAGGEGLVMRFAGQGIVYIQTMHFQSMAKQLVPLLPIMSI